MNLPTQGQVAAFGRHVLTFAAGGVTFASTLHIISADQATTISTSLGHIANGFNELAAGIGPLVAMASGLYAAWSASNKSRVQSVAKIPGTVVVTEPQLATAVPANNVVSNTDNKVISSK